MCGIAGFFGGKWPSERQATAILAGMNRRIRHRGPDHAATWADADGKIGFAFSRLAIVDLSPAGNQPMFSPSGRWVIIFNGEIYNHLKLRRQLDEEGRGGEWRGHSDTETLLAGIDAWGVRGALERSIGMFALALWDRQERQLILARDRMGEKPLYYGWQGQGENAAFLFGSELKALRRHPAFEGEIDRDALTLLMRHNHIPAPHSIYRGVAKLMPGCFATLRPGRRKPEVEAYWSAIEAAAQGARHPVVASPAEAVDSLERLLMDAVGQQMIADVPLGAFLSGGVDSSTVVALMQAQSSRPVKTFSIGFYEEEYDEAVHARKVAEHLGTDHSELYVTAEQAMRVIPALPQIYDEPFADPSQIPTFLIAQLARRSVTVSLSGDAGDELFGGYNRYKMTAAFWRRMSMTPRPLRGLVAKALTGVSPRAWNRLASAVEPVLPASLRMRLPGDKIHKLAGVLNSATVAELYHGLVSNWRDPQAVVIGGREPATQLTGGAPALTGLSEIERMMALDMITYLPGDILAKVDRAAMSVSLETRMPLLDHRVVEYAWRLPQQLKIHGGQTKWVLRQILYRHVPRDLIERPKMGFGVPVGDWLRGPLRDWADALLDRNRLAGEGYFHAEAVHDLWQAHLRGDVNEQYRLWIVLAFQAWLEAERGGARLPDADAPPRAVA